MFKRILIALSIVMAFAGPAVAMDGPELQALAARNGCDIPVYMHEVPDFPAFNAGFAVRWDGEQSLHFVNFSRLPESWQLYIFYHELGHCMQYNSGRLEVLEASGDVNAVEWDADEYAIRRLEDHRLDGAAIQADVLAEIGRLLGNDSSDRSHGEIRARIQNGNLKRTRPQVES